MRRTCTSASHKCVMRKEEEEEEEEEEKEGQKLE
jgi:hypothetical protein